MMKKGRFAPGRVRGRPFFIAHFVSSFELDYRTTRYGKLTFAINHYTGGFGYANSRQGVHETKGRSA